MALTEEEYKKLIDLCLKLRLADSILAEALEEIHKANAVLREMILRKVEE